MADDDIIKRTLAKHYADAVQAKESERLAAPRPFPGDPSLYQGAIENLPERPVAGMGDKFTAANAEVLSPTMGGYGMGQLLAETYGHGQEGEWAKAAETGIPLALGIFAGPGARTADLTMMARAQELAKAGAGRDAIWKETGWFQGKDGKWRFEIPDNDMGIHNVKDWFPPKQEGKPAMAPNFGSGYDAAVDKLDAAPQVGDIFYHDKLDAAYPRGPMAMPMGAFTDPKTRGAIGLTKDGRKVVALNEALTPPDAKSTGLHELQHLVQEKEGFALGANPETMPKNAPLTRHPIIKQMRENHAQRVFSDPEYVRSGEAMAEWDRILRLEEQAMAEYNFDAYQRAAGEVEARNVQARRLMSPEDRKLTPPWETEDVPSARQILSEKYGGPQMSVGKDKQPSEVGNFDFSPGQSRSVDIGNTSLSYLTGDGEVELTSLGTPEALRGQGSATKALEAFTAALDKAGLSSRLIARGDADMEPSRLRSLYGSFGYQLEPNGTMVRYPQPRSGEGKADGGAVEKEETWEEANTPWEYTPPETPDDPNAPFPGSARWGVKVALPYIRKVFGDLVAPMLPVGHDEEGSPHLAWPPAAIQAKEAWGRFERGEPPQPGDDILASLITLGAAGFARPKGSLSAGAAHFDDMPFDLPEVPVAGEKAALKSKKGVNRAQTQSKKWGDAIAGVQRQKAGPPDAPKTEYFGRSLAGDQSNPVIDSHASRALAMATEDPRFVQNAVRYFDPNTQWYESFSPREMLESGELPMKELQNQPTYWWSRPTKGEYKYAQEPFRKAADKFDLSPGQAQAAAWYGAASKTGVKTPPSTFMELFEQRLRDNAETRGIDPEDLLKRVINGETHLFANPKEAALPSVLATAQREGYTGPHGSGDVLPAAVGRDFGPGARPGEGPERAGVSGGSGRLAEPGGPDDSYAPIPGIPASVKIPGHGEVEAKPIPWLVDAATAYMRARGVPHELPEAFAPIDVERAKRIAQAYDEMLHDPTNPEVRRAYDALADETLAQYKFLKDAGAEFRFNEGGVDPYAASPAMGYPELRDERSLSIFPTAEGYGSGFSPLEVANNPLLKGTDIKFGDNPATVNDVFRAVHDAYGHYAYGNPFFRAPGEERAWMIHSGMYSPEARGAMTTELRGQNNWLNYGPHGEANRKASAADTIFADQKAGLMPEWTWEEGRKGISREEAINRGIIERALGLVKRMFGGRVEE